jgi:hypothetical protein
LSLRGGAFFSDDEAISYEIASSLASLVGRNDSSTITWYRLMFTFFETSMGVSLSKVEAGGRPYEIYPSEIYFVF